MWLQFWTSTNDAILQSVFLNCIFIIFQISNSVQGEASGLSLAEPMDKTTISKKYFLEANHIIVCTCGF